MLESYDDILTVDEACEVLKIGKKALYDLLNSGTLKAMRNGRVWRIPKTAIQEYIVKAVGISGKDGTTLRVNKRYSNGQDIGFVGEIKEVNTDLLYKLLDNDLVPVICPIGSDDGYYSYNINADDAACAIAAAMGASKLAFLTDIEGVYKDPLNKDTLISRFTVQEAEEFLASGYVGGGMLPKLQNCIDAIKSGVSRVHILDGRLEHCLLLEFFTDNGVGTAIISDEQE